MEKGFSLIEVIVYIGLLSLLMIGIFSSTMGFLHFNMVRSSFSESDYQLLIQNFHE